MGSGLAIQPDGTVVTNLALNASTEPLYEHRDIWAEESAGLTANNAEWSFGNGATGVVGLPIGENWEVVEMGFQADVYSAGTSITIDLIDISDGTTNNTISSMSLTNENDGGGGVNNAFKLQVFDPPVAIPAQNGQGCIGFITRGFSGTASDARVSARMRRQVGTYVSGVSLA